MKSDIESLERAAAPKTDQLNADDLIGGPIDVTVTRVSMQGDRPALHLDGGRMPWLPCKGMMRVLIAMWGAKLKDWPDTVRLRLYRDPAVKYGGEAVGGVRVSHAWPLDKRLDLPTTIAKGKRQMHVVLPMDPPAPAAPPKSKVDTYRSRLAAVHAESGGAALADAWGKTPAEIQAVLDPEFRPLLDAKRATMAAGLRAMEDA